MNLDWHGHWRVKGRKGMPQRSALNGNGLQNSSPAEVQQSGDMPAGQLRLRSGTCRVGRSKRVLPCYRKESPAHPWIYATYIALRDYYYALGDVKNALKADEQNSKAHQLADPRNGW